MPYPPPYVFLSHSDKEYDPASSIILTLQLNLTTVMNIPVIRRQTTKLYSVIFLLGVGSQK